MAPEQKVSRGLGWRKVVFALLLLFTCLIMIHLGGTLFYCTYGVNNFAHLFFLDADSETRVFLWDLIESRLLEPLRKLDRIDLDTNLREAAELGIEYKEICAIYIVKNPETLHSIFLLASTAIYDKEIKSSAREIFKNERLLTAFWDENRKWLTKEVEISDKYFQFTLLGRDEDVLMIIVDAERMKRILPALIDDLKNSSRYRATERYILPVLNNFYLTKVYLYDFDSAESFWEYGDQRSGRFWDEFGMRNLGYLGWRYKIEIYPKFEGFIAFAKNSDRFPWILALETVVGLGLIFVLAYAGSKLKRQ